MRRLVSPVADGGLPYLNSDFGDILQNESLKSYAGHLDAINDVPLLSNASMDRGIWLRPPLIISTTLTSATLDFRNSLCYIPGLTQSGDFFEPATAINTTITIPYQQFYIVADTATYENRVFKSAQSQPVIEKKYFTWDAAPASNIPYIRYFGGRTARNYQRVLKYKLAQVGEIFITSNINDFDSNQAGLGVGNMTGFALCNGFNGTLDLRGRFVIGYDPTKPTTPVDNTSTTNPANLSDLSYDSTDTMNYGAIGNKGGGVLDVSNTLYPSHLLQSNQNGRHTHGSDEKTGYNDANLDHQHLPAAQKYAMADNLTSSGSGNSTRSSLEGNRTTQTYTGGVWGGSDAMRHKHSIEYQPQSGSQRHETRAPYIVLAYYQKI